MARARGDGSANLGYLCEIGDHANCIRINCVCYCHRDATLAEELLHDTIDTIDKTDVEIGVDEYARSYTSGEVVELTGLTYRQITHWAKMGLYVPSIAKSRGTGKVMKWSGRDVEVLRVAKWLCDAGITPGALRGLGEALVRNPDWRRRWLVLDRDKVTVAYDEKELMEMIGKGRVVHVGRLP